MVPPVAYRLRDHPLSAAPLTNLTVPSRMLAPIVEHLDGACRDEGELPAGQSIVIIDNVATLTRAERAVRAEDSSSYQPLSWAKKTKGRKTLSLSL